MKYIKLIELQNNNLIWNKKLIPWYRIKHIRTLKLSEGFNTIYSGGFQNEYFRFGFFKKQLYLLGSFWTPFKFKFKTKHKIPSTSRSGILIKMSGRLGGVNKARHYRIGGIKTQSVVIPIDYKSNPIQTKWGKLGLKVYLTVRNEYKKI